MKFLAKLNRRAVVVLGLIVAVSMGVATFAAAAPADRLALFGETHVHTSLSFDAFVFGNRNGPDDAYHYARGATLKHPSGFDMKLTAPLDFQAVTDHAMYLGMVPAMYDTSTNVSKHPVSTALREAESPFERRAAFEKVVPYAAGIIENDDLIDRDIIRSAWQEVVESAEKHYEPGKFTTFIGYEFTISQDVFENLHRNVIFKGKAPDTLLSRYETNNPENLWRWMDELREQGMDSFAIPHNSNGSDGYMFYDKTYEGNPLTREYAELRMRNEPIVEVTQVKGTSETHPALSPNDEFANFEIMPYQIATWHPSKPKGSYVRDAYLHGLQLAEQGKGNPYKFGLIGASDTHVGAGGFDEHNYWSKIGVVDSNGKLRGAVKLTWVERLFFGYANLRSRIANFFTPPANNFGTPPKNKAPGFFQTATSTWGASGLAGVWAEENTRESIFAAFLRKEVFATSGPRMRVRLFAGYDIPKNITKRTNMTKILYARGVPMGGDIIARDGKTPSLVAWSARDPKSGALQRMQIVKGWIENGKTHEHVYDVACAGGVKPDPTTHRCPNNNAKVNLDNCETSADSGADELAVHWNDPDFNAKLPGFYYVRVLENPSCRWSTWDAIRENSPRNPTLAATIQERAWSSPIWYEN